MRGDCRGSVAVANVISRNCLWYSVPRAKPPRPPCAAVRAGDVLPVCTLSTFSSALASSFRRMTGSWLSLVYHDTSTATAHLSILWYDWLDWYRPVTLPDGRDGGSAIIMMETAMRIMIALLCRPLRPPDLGTPPRSWPG